MAWKSGARPVALSLTINRTPIRRLLGPSNAAILGELGYKKRHGFGFSRGGRGDLP